MPADLPDDPGRLVAALQAKGFVAVRPEPGLAVDLRYATANNFVGRPVYGGLDRLLLHPIAADKLARSVAWLNAQASEDTLLVLDGLRPNRIQRLFWDAVAGGPLEKYVGNPAIGSVHGFGLAVDATLIGPDGRERDMGTAFDDFTARAEPQREAALLATGELTPAQCANRDRLRAIMTAGGFAPIAIEWWHFDALPADEVRRSFRLVE